MATINSRNGDYGVARLSRQLVVKTELYFVIGDDRGRTKIKTISIINEDEKYYYARNKRYKKSKESQGYGSIYDWKFWTTNLAEAKQHQIDSVTHFIEANKGYIDFTKYELKRDFGHILQDLREDIPKEIKREIYLEMRSKYYHAIDKYKAIIVKLEISLETLKEETK